MRLIDADRLKNALAIISARTEGKVRDVFDDVADFIDTMPTEEPNLQLVQLSYFMHRDEYEKMRDELLDISGGRVLLLPNTVRPCTETARGQRKKQGGRANGPLYP